MATIPEYNRIDYENDTLMVQDAKRDAIRRQIEQERRETENNEDEKKEQ